METATSHHSSSSGSSNAVPPKFLRLLYEMVFQAQEDFSAIIYWNDSRQTFFICDRDAFTKKVLPVYFHHQNFQSFLRQLNMYGFRKNTILLDSKQTQKQQYDEAGQNNSSSQQQASLMAEEGLEFGHPMFKKNQEHLLHEIRRKSSVAHYQSTLDLMKEQHTHTVDTCMRGIVQKTNKAAENQEYIDKQLVSLCSRYNSLILQYESLIEDLSDGVQDRLKGITKSRNLDLSEKISLPDHLSTIAIELEKEERLLYQRQEQVRQYPIHYEECSTKKKRKMYHSIRNSCISGLVTDSQRSEHTSCFHSPISRSESRSSESVGRSSSSSFCDRQ